MTAMLTMFRPRFHLVLLALSLAALAAVGFDAAVAMHGFHLARLGVWGGMA
ncbi:MAG: hypothetical protein M0031_13390 [Thermaerobacter sp.]|jgi:hypothetical protein|nr:hypothetical protein [Thermaerobacter sp.]